MRITKKIIQEKIWESDQEWNWDIHNGYAQVPLIARKWARKQKNKWRKDEALILCYIAYGEKRALLKLLR